MSAVNSVPDSPTTGSLVPDKAQTPYKFQRLDLACGQNPREGFTGLDIAGNPEYLCDLMQFPWRVRKYGELGGLVRPESVEELHCSHYVEHIPHRSLGQYHDPFFRFFDECWLVLVPGGLMTVIAPYYASIRAIQDPTHTRSIGESTFLYLTAEWRKSQKLDHYPVTCDFEIVRMDHLVDETVTKGRSQEALQWMVRHDWNVVNDLMVILRKKVASGNPTP